MGIIDNMKSKLDDNGDTMDRMRMLTDKLNDGSITDSERTELMRMQNHPSSDSK